MQVVVEVTMTAMMALLVVGFRFTVGIVDGDMRGKTVNLDPAIAK